MMFEVLQNGVVLFAQGQDGGGSNVLSMFIYLLPIPFLFYFLIIRPQQQQEKTRRAMIDALKKNDKVLTSGGIYGTVVSVDANNDRVVLRVDDERGLRLTFTKSSVSRVLEASSEKSAEPGKTSE
ncbi:MAG: preprotein translocase subunit YajC [Isosphaeraceae bacterium]